jgi:hypothetical protein
VKSFSFEKRKKKARKTGEKLLSPSSKVLLRVAVDQRLRRVGPELVDEDGSRVGACHAVHPVEEEGEVGPREQGLERSCFLFFLFFFEEEKVNF